MFLTFLTMQKKKMQIKVVMVWQGLVDGGQNEVF